MRANIAFLIIFICICTIGVPMVIFSKENNLDASDMRKYCISDVAPQKLSLSYFLNSKKFRTIHHDSFCRAANCNEIGNNALPNRSKILGYNTFSTGKISVGIKTIEKNHDELCTYFKNTLEINSINNLSKNDPRKYHHYASNFSKSNKFGRVIKYIETKRSSYHAIIIRADDMYSDSKIAFFIDDIDNFYYASITNNQTEIGRFFKGRKNKILSSPLGGKELEIYVNGCNADIRVNDILIHQLKSTFNSTQICGLMFDNSTISNIDEFIVNYQDEYQDAGIDDAIENNNIQDNSLGYFCAIKDRCTTSDRIVKSGGKALKFTLIKPNEKELTLDRNNALHSTFMLNGIIAKGGNDYCGRLGGNKPLDSFVFSADVFFPEHGDEKWELDEFYQELILQEHHVGYRLPFSPSISVNLNKGRIYLNTIWQEHLPFGENVHENPTTVRRQFIGRINTNDEEKYLSSKGYNNLSYLTEYKKGIWHNITMYVKLGYTYGQNPRTILYMDNQKIIDWNTPNAYNCQDFGEYLEFGIYKWDWENEDKREKSSINKRVIYFDNIHYYI